jgi:hypothetical protein
MLVQELNSKETNKWQAEKDRRQASRYKGILCVMMMRVYAWAILVYHYRCNSLRRNVPSFGILSVFGLAITLLTTCRFFVWVPIFIYPYICEANGCNNLWPCRKSILITLILIPSKWMRSSWRPHWFSTRVFILSLPSSWSWSSSVSGVARMAPRLMHDCVLSG